MPPNYKRHIAYLSMAASSGKRNV